MDYSKIIQEIGEQVSAENDHGNVADYIPELAFVDPDRFGIYLLSNDGTGSGWGNYEQQFSLQSVNKVFALSMAMALKGDKLWQRVGVEPSGNPFNSLVQLEYESGIPRNPLINSGAIVISDILVSALKNPQEEFLAFVQELTQNKDINYNYRIANSERDWGFRNAALANLMKAFGNIENDVEEVLQFYFNLCSIEMSCKELAQSVAFLTHKGMCPATNKQLVSTKQSMRINALMQTCGFYDEAGEFSFRVGLPGKSGVGGGIAAICPGRFTIGLWSPRLNAKGNSVKGMRTLELLTERTGYSIF
ncbi:glutaminase [Chitinophagales bacterium]|nr:glutaminase [Chitinophagales bacterium]